MKNIIILLALITIPMLSHADGAEQDKKSGTCAMYLALAKKSNIGNYNVTPEEAFALADKESRAAQFSKMYVDKIKDYQARKISTAPLLSEGVKSCYDLGFKLSR